MGFHTFYVSFQNTDNIDHQSVLRHIAERYDFSVVKGSWVSRMYKHKDNYETFSCQREVSGLAHWWIGGEKGMEIKAKALALDIKQHLDDNNVAIERFQLAYMTGSP